jgi:hypothetical protein
VNRYGIGVDCHSRFFQICALARRDDVVLKYKDKCDAACSDLIECKARVIAWLAKRTFRWGIGINSMAPLP